VKDWQAFVLEHGSRAYVHDLAAVLGRTPKEIDAARVAGCRKGKEPKRFAELFMLWHARPPRDEEWPAPLRQGAARAYEWQSREDALLATLVGRFDKVRIAKMLTERLRKLTGDRRARRTPASILVRMQKIGMQSRDVVGGITASDAGREVGSYCAVIHALEEKRLPSMKIGHHLVIPRDAWEEFKAERKLPPPGYVQLSTLKGPLSVRSDKLSEFARAGFVPTAEICTPFTAKNARGVWFIDGQLARKLVRDRHAGRPMPWQGVPLHTNLKQSYRRWQERLHPASCKACVDVWRPGGAPRSFEEYCKRYPPLTLGAKRHLTRPWSKASAELLERRERTTYTEAEAARRAGVSVPKLVQLVKEIGWRTSGRLSLPLVQAIVHRQTRLEARTVRQAAGDLGQPMEWVRARIADGTIRVKRAKWDRRVVCITRPMYARLKAALTERKKRKPGKAWLQLKTAAELAGVSTSQVQLWGNAGEVVRQRPGYEWRYARWSILAQARRHWQHQRLKRAIPPDWLAKEVQTH
jgi:hypothetical protein